MQKLKITKNRTFCIGGIRPVELVEGQIMDFSDADAEVLLSVNGAVYARDESKVEKTKAEPVEPGEKAEDKKSVCEFCNGTGKNPKDKRKKCKACQ